MLAEGSGDCFLTFNVVPCRSHTTHCSSMPTKKDIAFTNGVGKGQKGGRIRPGADRISSEKPTELLTE